MRPIHFNTRISDHQRISMWTLISKEPKSNNKNSNTNTYKTQIEHKSSKIHTIKSIHHPQKKKTDIQGRERNVRIGRSAKPGPGRRWRRQCRRGRQWQCRGRRWRSWTRCHRRRPSWRSPPPSRDGAKKTTPRIPGGCICRRFGFDPNRPILLG